VEGLSDCLRMELKQFGIDVIVIEPGIIKTEWNKIAEENMTKVSGKTVYSDSANKHIKMFEKMYRNGSEPIVIARVIEKAINAKRPKTRYAAGSGARFTLLARKLLSDRIFDKTVLSQMK